MCNRFGTRPAAKSCVVAHHDGKNGEMDGHETLRSRRCLYRPRLSVTVPTTAFTDDSCVDTMSFRPWALQHPTQLPWLFQPAPALLAINHPESAALQVLLDQHATTAQGSTQQHITAALSTQSP
jgi:hypothetical protein